MERGQSRIQVAKLVKADAVNTKEYFILEESNGNNGPKERTWGKMELKKNRNKRIWRCNQT